MWLTKAQMETKVNGRTFEFQCDVAASYDEVLAALQAMSQVTSQRKAELEAEIAKKQAESTDGNK